MYKPLEEQPASNFGLLLDEMRSKFAQWEDEFFVRVFGFRISELRRQEELVAWYTTAESLTEEGEVERDRLIDNYKKVWRPRRDLLMRRKAGMR